MRKIIDSEKIDSWGLFDQNELNLIDNNQSLSEHHSVIQKKFYTGNTPASSKFSKHYLLDQDYSLLDSFNEEDLPRKETSSLEGQQWELFKAHVPKPFQRTNFNSEVLHNETSFQNAWEIFETNRSKLESPLISTSKFKSIDQNHSISIEQLNQTISESAKNIYEGNSPKQSVLVFEIGDIRYAVLSSSIKEIVSIESSEKLRLNDSNWIVYQNHIIPLILRERQTGDILLGTTQPTSIENTQTLILCQIPQGTVGIISTKTIGLFNITEDITPGWHSVGQPSISQNNLPIETLIQNQKTQIVNLQQFIQQHTI